MANYWKIVNDVIKESDVLVLIADARVPESVNQEVLKKVTQHDKKYLVVFNKVDLLDDAEKKILNKEKTKYEFAIAVSARYHDGTMALLRKINAIVHGKKAVVGIVGYPNTGKSSIINAIKGKNSAPVSSQAGHTKGIQKLRVTQKIILLDTPGVIPFEDKKAQNLHALIAARSPNQLKDPDGAAMKIIQYLEGKVEDFYGVPRTEDKDYDDTLEVIAEKLNLKKKGNVLDSRRAAIQIIMDWQKGNIL